MRTHPDSIFVEFRHFPHSGKLSEDLAKISVCSGKQGQFLALADAFYKNQKEITYENIDSFIPESINQDEIKDCVNSYELMNLIRADFDEVTRLNINVTPSVFVNGYVGDLNMIQSEINKLNTL